MKASTKLAVGLGAVAVSVIGMVALTSKKADASVQPGYVPSWKTFGPQGGRYKFESGQIYGVAVPLTDKGVKPEATKAALSGMGLLMLDATTTPPHAWPYPKSGNGYMVFTTETDKSFSEAEWGAFVNTKWDHFILA